MNATHLVRVGIMGHIGPFHALQAMSYARCAQVIVRTSRGLEIGEVLAPPGEDREGPKSEGPILREMTAEDRWIAAQLDKNRRKATEACAAMLAERGLAATLVDVEHLFDGRSLYFYFLGDVPGELEAITDELAEAYDAKARFRQFAEAVADGCGPGCGTEGKAGSTCGNCSASCAMASACGSRRVQG